MSRRKRSGKQDDVLSLSDHSEHNSVHTKSDTSNLSDSGSNDEYEITRKSPQRAPLRSVVRKVTRNDKDRGITRPSNEPRIDKNNNGGHDVVSNSSNSIVDLNKLTPETVDKLRAALGLQEPTASIPTHGMLNSSDSDSYEVEMSDKENRSKSNVNCSFSNRFEDSLFDDFEDENPDDDSWPQAKLKAPELGDPVSESLAKLINDSCTHMCNVNETVDKYKVPSNCQFMSAPKVNEEIWGDLARQRRVQTTDRLLRDTQNLVTAGMIPILTLAKLLKPHIGKVPEIKTLIADSLTMLGQVQFNMSVRRRYLLRPFLKQKYASICNINTPITNYLFGDDVSKELKKCETSVRVGKYPMIKPTSVGPIRGRRGTGRWRARPYCR